ncbi:protein FAM81A [Clupea harengus]|uniref:Protein FAM81A n=1 Tax=Clupea harengus TaxID=7950 RepID=A0A6P8F0G6_CLUHA|nr:protein FAM81A [Clupea harengus]
MAPNLREGNENAVREAEDQEQIRLLLDDHIRAVTALIRRLNRDIQGVQQQMRAQDEVTHGTQTSVRRMELQQLAVLSDLRARVGRCDDSIARLAADFRGTNERIYRLIRQHHGSQTSMEAKLRDLETQVSLVCSKAARGSTPDQTSIPSGNIEDTRFKALSEELKAQITSAQSCLKTERDSVLRGALDKIESLVQSMRNRSSGNEKAMLERYGLLSDKLDRLEETQKKRGLPHPDRSLEEMIDSRVSQLQKKLWEEMQAMRAETNNGFTFVHDSLGSLRQVLEARMKLERDQLLRQIRLKEEKGTGEEEKDSQG